jgi:hypothetical protein
MQVSGNQPQPSASTLPGKAAATPRGGPHQSLSEKQGRKKPVPHHQVPFSGPVDGTLLAKSGPLRPPSAKYPRETDSLAEEAGFEPSVAREVKGYGEPLTGKHWCLGPEPVSGSAVRAAVSDWQRPEEPFAGAGPMVRIRFPPAVSLRTFGS